MDPLEEAFGIALTTAQKRLDLNLDHWRKAMLLAGGGGGTVIAAGENHIGQTGGTSAAVQATLAGVAPVIAAAGDYTAGDIMSDSTSAGTYFVFPDIARVSGGSGVIVKGIITTSVEAWVPRMRLWLFHTAPTTTALNDNAAFSLTVADRTKVVGYIDFAAGQDAGTVSYVENDTVRKAFKCVGSANLYGILQLLDAATNEAAGMTATITLFAMQD